MSTHVRYKVFDQLSFADVLVYSKLPPHPFWSHVADKIDFSFADRLCAVLYTGRGQHPYAPSLKLRIHLVKAYYGLSDRQTEEKIIGDLFIKRFLDLPVDFFGFDHSTIGLDRSRMGEAMFRACHLYILAQMYHYGLWGDRGEEWIIDSFSTNAHITRPGTYRLIQQAFLRTLQHLRKTAPKPLVNALASLPLDAVGIRLRLSASTAERMLAFSKLVGQAYGFLQWFRHPDIEPMLAGWEQYPRSQELQATLLRILEENSRSIDPDAGSGTMSDTDAEPEAEGAVDIQYVIVPSHARTKDCIVSAVDPEARAARKGSKIFVGYKTQNLCTSSGVILNTRTIPANEHDQEATAGMTAEIQHFFRMTPATLLGDAAYGHGKHRAQLAQQGIQVVAPLQTYENPTGLFPSSLFTYDADRDVYICPNGQQSVRKTYNAQLEGHQYLFDKHTCLSCPVRMQCTRSKASGRRVFRSDYVSSYEYARTYNDSIEGQTELQKRYTVERKNNELKNNCGLGSTNFRGRTRNQIIGLCAAMIVNLKQTVRKLVDPKPGFIRRPQMTD